MAVTVGPMIYDDSITISNNSFPGEEKLLHNSWLDQEHHPGGQCICILKLKVFGKKERNCS